MKLKYTYCTKTFNWQNFPKNKIDILNRHNEKGTYMLIDVAISGDRNVMNEEA
jgi:hypothetical protein